MGRQDLSSAEPHNPNTTTIVHPTQVLMTGTSDFVGWGTYKGAGTTGGITNCPTYTGTRWQVYVDGRTFGLYFCRAEYGSEPDVAANQLFETRHTTCPTNGFTNWVFFWNSGFKTCQAVNGTRGTPVVGSESIGFDPQEIDIHYELLQYRVLGSTWIYWTTVPAQDRCVSAGYTLTTSNGTTDWTMVH
jgi:hypothetical protein